MVWLGGSNDGSGHNRVLPPPGQRDVRHRDTASLRNLLDRLDDGPVALDVVPAADGVDIEALGVFAPSPGEPALRKGAVRNASYSLVTEQAEHLPLFLALHQVVLVLHRHKPGPTVQVSGVLHLGELPSPHGRRTDVASFPSFYDVVQSFHGLFDWRVRVEPVDLIQVD